MKTHTKTRRSSNLNQQNDEVHRFLNKEIIGSKIRQFHLPWNSIDFHQAEIGQGHLCPCSFLCVAFNDSLFEHANDTFHLFIKKKKKKKRWAKRLLSDRTSSRWAKERCSFSFNDGIVFFSLIIWFLSMSIVALLEKNNLRIKIDWKLPHSLWLMCNKIRLQMVNQWQPFKIQKEFTARWPTLSYYNCWQRR